MKKYVGKQVKAMFKPHPMYKSTLRPEVLACIGEIYTFTYSWLQNEGDPYPDIWALIAEHGSNLSYWVPEFDLEILEEL